MSHSRAASSSAVGDSKRRRLTSLVGLKGVTTEALASILENIRSAGDVPDLSAWQINRFVRQELDRVKLVLPLPQQDGQEFAWPVCRLDRLLQYYCEACPLFLAEFSRALRHAGDQPLNLILYLDEVVPGNLLRPDNRRRFVAFYVGVAEFGAIRLQQEEFWLPVALLRSTVANAAVGGLSACARLLVRSLLFAPTNLATAGAVVKLERPTLLRACLAGVLADESALKGFWLFKGASGTKPCMFCANIVALRSGLADEAQNLLDVSASDPSRFQAVSDEDVWAAYDSLAVARRTRPQREFEVLQQASGLTFDPAGLLADKELRAHLRPISATVFDWMHNFLVGGIVQTELHAFLGRCREVLGLRFSQFNDFVSADWRWPSWQQTHQVMKSKSWLRSGRAVCDSACPHNDSHARDKTLTSVDVCGQSRSPSVPEACCDFAFMLQGR
jgi:hypothetical protein